MNKKKYVFDEKQKQKIINDYQSGKMVWQIAEQLGCTQDVILRNMEEWKIPRRNKQERNRTYTLDRNFFDLINSPEKAYFLGFLYADGHNKADTGNISINLQERDVDILIKLKKLINSNCPLRFWKKRKDSHQNQFILSIYSVYMSQQLIKLGCVPKKSLILQFPTEDQVPRNFINHFIRRIF